MDGERFLAKGGVNAYAHIVYTERVMADAGKQPSDARAEALDRVLGSMLWLKPRERQRFRVKIFKSGNSIALRLPASLNLNAGMEVDLTVEDGERFAFQPVEQAKRKFNVAKVAGSATDLRPIRGEDRVFKDRPLVWPATVVERDASG